MVVSKKRTLVICGLILLNILVLLGVLLWDGFSGKYLYPSLKPVDPLLWVVNVAVLLGFDLLVISIVMLARSGHKLRRLIGILLATVLVPYTYFAGAWLVTASTACWQSYTEDETQFGVIDDSLDDQFEIAELRMSDIVSLSHNAVSNYTYTYQSEIGADIFNVAFDMQLTKYGYDTLMQHLHGGNEFECLPRDTFVKHTGESKNVTGMYVLKEGETLFADQLKHFCIAYDEESRIVYFEFSGECYT